jgi:predicted phosphoribosyltransferase
MSSSFADRRAAGGALAATLRAGLPARTLVLALPRGGVPVGHEVARRLGLPLDVLVVRKLGTPGRDELAMGAIASGGARVVNPEVLADLDDPAGALAGAEAREAPELERRERAYRGGRPPAAVADRPVLLVDDGAATGATMRVAIRAVRARGAGSVLVGLPVVDARVRDALAAEADDVRCVLAPSPIGAVGAWYRDFAQTSDEEVRALLAGSRTGLPSSGGREG